LLPRLALFSLRLDQGKGRSTRRSTVQGGYLFWGAAKILNYTTPPRRGRSAESWYLPPAFKGGRTLHGGEKVSSIFTRKRGGRKRGRGNNPPATLARQGEETKRKARVGGNTRWETPPVQLSADGRRGSSQSRPHSSLPLTREGGFLAYGNLQQDLLETRGTTRKGLKGCGT